MDALAIDAIERLWSDQDGTDMAREDGSKP
jgi:hypothetical protein